MPDVPAVAERSPALMENVRAKIGLVETPADDSPDPEVLETPAVPAGEVPATPEAGTEEAAEPPKETPPEGELAVETFSIEIPTANADGSKGPAGTGTLVLEGLPQEYRDTLQYHVKRSSQIPGLERKLGEARSQAALGDFYRQRPLEAMHVVAQERPEMAQQFVETWLKANWRQAAALYDKAGLTTADEALLEERAWRAQREAKDAVSAGQAQLHQTTRNQAYASQVDDTVSALLTPLGLSDDDRNDFDTIIFERLSRAHEDRKARGLDPYLSPIDVTQLVQPLVQKWSERLKSPVAKATLPTKPKATTAEDLQKRADKAAQLRKVAGTAPRTGITPSKVEKRKPSANPLMDRIKAIREMRG